MNTTKTDEQLQQARKDNENMLSFKERYNFYTNRIFNETQKYDFIVPKKYLNHIQNEPMYIPKNNKGCIFLNNNYLKRKKIHGDYLIVCNDGYNNHELPCFQKTRKINNHSKFSILLRLEAGRHWGPFYGIKDNLNWQDKKNEIIYRGSPTGMGDRTKFCELYYQKYNVGLSGIFDHQKYNENIKKLVKDEIKIEKFFDYKYIISIEGNEKDSGINWKLNSNSVVIMRPPKFESWLMESYLKPYIHYIPLKEDFSDLDEIYTWCLNNDEKCQNIVKNANEFCKNFKNEEIEMKLIEKIEDDYYKYINLKIDDI